MIAELLVYLSHYFCHSSSFCIHVPLHHPCIEKVKLMILIITYLLKLLISFVNHINCQLVFSQLRLCMCVIAAFFVTASADEMKVSV